MSSIDCAGWAVFAAAVICTTGCAASSEDTGEASRALDGMNDGAAASLTTACDLSKPFDPPVLVAGFDDRDVLSFRPSADELSAALSILNGPTGTDLYVASRATNADPFVIGAPIAELNTASDEYWPSLSADGKMMFFESDRPLVSGGPTHDSARIWTATRPSTTAAFGAPEQLGIFLGETPEGAPYLHPNGSSLYFASAARGGAGQLDLFVADITDFGVVTAVRSLTAANSAAEENMPVPSNDERAVFFSRWVGSARDVWVVGRASASGAFGVAQEVVEVTTPDDEWPSAVSADACRLYFISDRAVAGTKRYRVWVAQKPT